MTEYPVNIYDRMALAALDRWLDAFKDEADR